MAKRVKTNKKTAEKIKETKSKIKEIKTLDVSTKQKTNISALEKEVKEKDLVFDQSPSLSASTSSIETNMTLRPTTALSQNEEEIPRSTTQFQREDQRNFSQSISYNQQNPYQQQNTQRSYQTSAASAPQLRSPNQNQPTRQVESSSSFQSRQNLTLSPSNSQTENMINELESSSIQREIPQQDSRYSYKEKSLPDASKRRRDMF
ncbi:MAG: hypothetical protein AABW75_04365 [Nanoarchaeota archaeon]